MREKIINNVVRDLEKKTDELMDEFSMFTHGTRVLLLLWRHKEGGSNNEYRRRVARVVVHDKERMKKEMFNLLLQQYLADIDLRLYMSVSPRDMRKAELAFKEALLQTDFSDGDNKVAFYQNFSDKWISALMSSNPPKGEKLFVVDVDVPDNSEALKWLGTNHIDVLKQYKTKQGWHLVTPPFDRSKFPKELGEIQDDGLLLLSYKP